VVSANAADGRWEATVEIGSIDGQRKRQYLYGKSRRDVQDKLDRPRGNVRDGLPVLPQRVTVGAFLEHWLAEVIQPNRRHSTAVLRRLHPPSHPARAR
jgi:integrase